MLNRLLPFPLLGVFFINEAMYLILRALLIIFLFLAITCASVQAQGSEPVNPNRGAVPGASYYLSDIENINLTNGNVMLNFPLVSTPKWRGGLSLTSGFMYNSKLYDTIILEQLNHSNQLTNQHFIKQSLEGGWKGFSSMDFRMKVSNRFEPGESIPCELGVDSYTYGKNAAIWKVQIVFPDGSAKEFRPTGYTDPYNDGFFRVSANGYESWTTWATIGIDPACNQGETLITTGPMLYYSTDGSFTRLEIDHDFTPYSSGLYSPFTLHFADGSNYRSSNKRLTDRNGNYIEGSQFTYNGLAAEGLTDESGRKVFSTEGSNPDETYLYQLGFGGAEIKWTIRRKTIYVRRQYETTEATSLMERGGSSTQIFDEPIDVIYEIVQPVQLGGQKYEFEYYASDTPLSSTEFSEGWGEIKSVRLPSGAKAEYEYNSLIGPPMTNTKRILERSIRKKTLTFMAEYDGGSSEVEEEWSYLILNSSATITSPDGSVMTQAHGDTSFAHANAGLVQGIANSNGTKVEKLWASNKSPWAPYMNQFVKAEFTSIKDEAGNYVFTAIKEFTTDKNGNTTSVKEYHFVPYGNIPRGSNGYITGLPIGITPARSSYTAYYNPTPDSTDATTNHVYAYWNYSPIKNVVNANEVQNSAGNPVSRTEIGYDNYSTTANPTAVKNWDSYKGGTYQPHTTPLTLSNSVSTSATYNQYGLPLTTTDANGVVTTITYGTITTPTGSVSDLYPTQTVSAYGTPLARTSAAAYDFYTGLVTTATDVDNNVSVVNEYDALGRSTKVRSAAGTPLESWTRTEYNDVARRVIVRSDLETIGDGKKVAVQHYDQLGRVRLSRSIENIATQDPYNETHGIKVETRYQTGNPNSYQLTSNPFRAATATAATNEPSMGWTRSKSWNTGRKQQVETFSGAALPAPWGSNANSTGVVTTDIDADRILVTDQAGKQRISRTNALGQLKDIWEVTASDSATEAISFPNQALSAGYRTSYNYDTLNNLTTVNQGVQTRSFAYSSLSRLLSTQNPESGTINYLYDNNGNLTRKTDARNIQTNFTYDSLNRVTLRDYSETTPDVTYLYDNLPNAKGKLIKVSSSVSTTEYTAFDILGRVTAHKQTTDGNPYTTGYIYNLSGALIEETYPSGSIVKNVLDNEGDLSMVQSKKNAASGYFNYAKNFTYTAAGAVSSMQLGNGKWESTQFNSRLQPTQIALGTVQNGTDKLKLDYSYGTTANNGNVLSQTIVVNRSNQSPLVFSQSYVYDSLNRLKSAEEISNSVSTWKQTYAFDRYGNRRFDQANTSQPASFANPNVTNPTIDIANNRFTTGQGYTYDLAGNVITDAEGRSFQYDAENKQKEARNSSDATIGTYFFDGDGKRVKKYVPDTGETTIFVYDAGGKLVAEYSTVVAPVNDAKVQYLTNDNLGTPRINTDNDGNVTSRSDYMPYGEEIVALGGRSSSDSYVVDGVRQGFTGYINDDETGLDFAQARMYAKTLGRFTGVDPLLTSGRPVNPKSWNRYVYTLNNPLRFVDPTGLYECSGTEKQCSKFAAGLAKANEQLAKIEKRYGTKSTEYTDAVRGLKAYGTLGDKNGVTVGFAKLDGNVLGETGGTMKKTGENTVSVTIDPDKNKDDSDLLTTIAHEGSHVQDNSDYQGALLSASNISVEAADAVMSGGLRVTHGQSETRAFGVSSVFAEFTMGGAASESAMTSAGGTTTFNLGGEPVKATNVGGESIWKSSWQKLDVNTVRSNRSGAIAKGLPKSDYAPNLSKPIQ